MAELRIQGLLSRELILNLSTMTAGFVSNFESVSILVVVVVYFVRSLLLPLFHAVLVCFAFLVRGLGVAHRSGEWTCGRSKENGLCCRESMGTNDA
jgi:hypothetical protein